MTLSTERHGDGSALVRLAGDRLSRVPPLAWVGVISLASFASLVVASSGLVHPLVFRDELVYSGAAKRVALGAYAHSGSPFDYGLLYPLVLAPVYALFDGTTAYVAVKIVNAALFSACAVPAYFLARRVARPSLAIAVAALTLLLPSRAYTYLVLTESLAFLLFLVGTLALVRALERPTAVRQLVALAACVAAVEARRQSLVLLAALPVAILVVCRLDRGSGLRRRLAAYLPTWIALGAGIGVLAAWSLARGSSPGTALGAYSVLSGGYDVGGIAAWLRNDLSALGLMFAVIPLVALPLALRECFRRDAPAGHRALGAATLVLLPAIVLQVAMFSSTPYGLDFVHERYLFYVAPLLFALLALWIEVGAPRRVAVLAVGAVVALLPLMLPLHGLGRTNPVDAPVLYVLGYDPFSPSGRADQGLAGFIPAGTFHLTAVLVSAYLLAVLLLLRGRGAVLVVGVVAVFLVLVDVRVDEAYAGAGHVVEGVATPGSTGRPANWIERDLGRGRAVTFLYVAPSLSCRHGADQVARTEPRYWRTEFFNSNVSDVAAIGMGPNAGVRVETAHVDPAGSVLAEGAPVRARYVVADELVQLRGRRLDHDPASRLTLWQVDGAVRVSRAAGDEPLRRRVCRPLPAGA